MIEYSIYIQKQMHFYISSKTDVSIANWILGKLNTEISNGQINVQ